MTFISTVRVIRSTTLMPIDAYEGLDPNAAEKHEHTLPVAEALEGVLAQIGSDGQDRTVVEMEVSTTVYGERPTFDEILTEVVEESIELDLSAVVVEISAETDIDPTLIVAVLSELSDLGVDLSVALETLLEQATD
jgi:hypothetical protein